MSDKTILLKISDKNVHLKFLSCYCVFSLSQCLSCITCCQLDYKPCIFWLLICVLYRDSYLCSLYVAWTRFHMLEPPQHVSLCTWESHVLLWLDQCMLTMLAWVFSAKLVRTISLSLLVNVHLVSPKFLWYAYLHLFYVHDLLKKINRAIFCILCMTMKEVYIFHALDIRD